MSSWIAKPKRSVRVFRAPEQEQIQIQPYIAENIPTTPNSDSKVITYSKWNEFQPGIKRYLSGGKLGDFIYQLYVIKHNYDHYGKKGILYIGNVGDKFTFGLEKTYNDTKDLILSQEYIEDYQIYKNQKYDINLSNWRSLITLDNEMNWYDIYQKTFDVTWGVTKWITTDSDDSLQDAILFNHSSMRFNQNIKYKKLVDGMQQHHKVYFIGFDLYEYEQFQIKYNVSLPIILCKSITEMYQKINGCKIFIGNLSAPLAFSLSLHKPSIGILPTDPIHFFTDVKLNSNLDGMPFYKLIRNQYDIDLLLYSLQPIFKVEQVTSKDPVIHPAEPEVQPTEPEVEPAEPEVQPAEPEVQPAEPDVQPAEPEVEPAEPEVQQNEIEENTEDQCNF
jgi:hypothetical protein